MNTRDFEDNRWKFLKQTPEFRHEAAISLIKSGSVLDVGCGDGLLLRMLRERGIEGKGLDLSETAVTLCRADGFDVRPGDFTQEVLPFKDDSMDYVVALDVLEHLYHPEILLKEMARVARIAVIVGVPNFSSLPARLQVLMGHVPENNHPHKGHVYWFNFNILEQLCRSVGMRLGTVKTNTFFPFTLFGTEAPCMPNLLALSFVATLPKDSVQVI